MDWPPDHIAPSPSDRARLVWLDDPSLTSAEVALLAGCRPATAANARRSLENYGVLEPRREQRPRFPQSVPMPRAPAALMQGACVGVLPSPWTSDDPADRTRARLICMTECHVAAACLDWALAAVPVSDSAVYAGTGPSERRALRAARGIKRPNAVTAISAARQSCPECGTPLAGENLITEPGRRPGTVRRRCRNCTRIRKHEAYQRRRAAAAAEAAS